MFGYININKPELKVREFDRYRSYYCGLCRSLRDHYGISSRLSLSYDITFLVVLLTSLYEPKTMKSLHSCPAHPLTKHIELTNPYTDFGADMNLLCTYYTAEDQRLDAGTKKEFIYGKGLGLLYHNAFQKVKKKYPDKVARIEAAIRELHDLEATGQYDLDKACQLSGQIVSEFFVPDEDIWAEDLKMTGYHLGRFIYLMDAWEDIEKDLSSNCYNPLRPLYQEVSTEEFDSTVFAMMNMIMGECTLAFEKLPLIKDVEILRNILYSGVFTRRDLLLAKREAREKQKTNAVIDD